MSTKLFSIHHFFLYCKQRGVRVTTKPTYLKYERMGVFLPGEYSVLNKTRIDRLFTQSEMKQNADRLSEYFSQKKEEKRLDN